jgi:hypothetical protein
MMRADEPEDEAVDRAWRARYGQPLPVMGSTEIARKILTEWAAAAESSEPDDWGPDEVALPPPDPPLSS